MENIPIFEKLKEHDKRFDAHDQRFDEHDRKFDRVFGKLIEHDEVFDEIRIVLDDLKSGISRIITVLDAHTGVLAKLDHERLATHHRLEKLEKAIFKK